MKTISLKALCIAVVIAWPVAACAQPVEPPRATAAAPRVDRESPASITEDAPLAPPAMTDQPYITQNMPTEVRGFTLALRPSATERPALIVTQPMSAEVEAQWKEDLRVMDKLLTDQISPVSTSAYPQAMGIRLTTLGQAEPTYIEDLGTLFTYRVSLPLAQADGQSATRRAAGAQPSSAWDRAKRELNDPRISGYGAFAGPKEQSRAAFEQRDLDRLIVSILKILPEAANIRHLPPEQFVVVSIVGTDDAGAPMRLTLKALKKDINDASKGSITADEFARRVARRVR